MACPPPTPCRLLCHAINSDLAPLVRLELSALALNAGYSGDVEQLRVLDGEGRLLEIQAQGLKAALLGSALVRRAGLVLEEAATLEELLTKLEAEGPATAREREALPQIAVAAYGRRAAKARASLTDRLRQILPSRCCIEDGVPLALVVATDVAILMTVEHQGLGQHSHHSSQRNTSTTAPTGAAPTTLTLPLARALANLGRVPPGGLVMDSCSGGGGLASIFAEQGAMALASDINEEVLRAGAACDAASEEMALKLNRFVSSCLSMPVRAASVDAVVTDPPYGVRVTVGNSPGSRLDFFVHFARESERVLKHGGRLVLILPFRPDAGIEAAEMAATLAVGRLRLVGFALTEVDHRRPATKGSPAGQERREGGEHWQRCVVVCVSGEEKPWPQSAYLKWQELRHLHTEAETGKPQSSELAQSIAPADVLRAAWVGDIAKLRAFTDAGGDPNAGDASGRSLLLFAAGYGRAAAVRHLCAARADPQAASGRANDDIPLVRASRFGHTEVVKALLEATVTPSASSCQAASEDESQLTRALRAAVTWLHGQTLRLLIGHFPQSSLQRLREEDGANLLRLALQRGSAEIASLLRDAKVIPASQPQDLPVAAQSGSVEAVRWVLSNLPDAQQQREAILLGRPAAALWSRSEVVTFLDAVDADHQEEMMTSNGTPDTAKGIHTSTS